jgi:four helix bundle protein
MLAVNRYPVVAAQVVDAMAGRRQAIRHFTDLIVWQKAFEVGLRVFTFPTIWPPEERYALIDQVRRSSRSVSANVAEAWEKRRYEAHFVSKLSAADAELLETENWLRYARAHGYLSPADFDAVLAVMREVGRMLGGIMKNPAPFLLRNVRNPNT